MFTAQDSAGVIPCLQCGFDLRGMSRDADCPECGLDVKSSLDQQLLKFASPQWVEALAGGMNWLMISVLLTFGLSCLGGTFTAFSGGFGIFAHLGNALLLIPGAVAFYAMWRLTTPEPDALVQHDHPARRVLRIALVVGFIASILGVAMSAVSVSSAGCSEVIGGMAGIVVLFGLFVYLNALALRLPDPALAHATRRVMWGIVGVYALMFGYIAFMAAFWWNSTAPAHAPVTGGVLMVPICMLVVAVLVLFVRSLVLGVRYRRELLGAARQARRLRLEGGAEQNDPRSFMPPA